MSVRDVAHDRPVEPEGSRKMAKDYAGEVDHLIAAGLVQPERRDEAVAAVAAYWSDPMCFTFTTEDVLESYPELPEEEAAEVLMFACYEKGESIWNAFWDVIADTVGELGDEEDEEDEEDEDGLIAAERLEIKTQV
jgi:hypothetical protein